MKNFIYRRHKQTFSLILRIENSIIAMVRRIVAMLGKAFVESRLLLSILQPADYQAVHMSTTVSRTAENSIAKKRDGCHERTLKYIRRNRKRNC